LETHQRPKLHASFLFCWDVVPLTARTRDLQGIS